MFYSQGFNPQFQSHPMSPQFEQPFNPYEQPFFPYGEQYGQPFAPFEQSFGQAFQYEEPYSMYERMPQVYLQNPNDLKPFIGKWGIFTINGQRIVAYVDSIDVASQSARVYYPNNQTGIIDITMISMAEGPFVTMPSPGPGPGPGRCRWMWIPRLGWQYICF